MSFNAIVALANIANVLLHLNNARSAMKIGMSPASSFRWAAFSSGLTAYFGLIA
ncbi:hypothetical protein [Thiocapsa sp. UBA6158]|uniref:hypothetical protein n=1 Tax=Thiocapsa sp. UBA6158 TaxID=1947692 RepID=UPI0025EED18B|nr:hypothetical protein [Thiocapsa sp. UBA6158]